MTETPEGLHDFQYAAKICEDLLSWPATKSNLELIGGCIGAIAKGRKLLNHNAYKYLARAIKLAKEQGVEVNGKFFREGEYMNMRPAKKEQRLQSPEDLEVDAERFREHGCHGGWIYVEDGSGVVRCARCYERTRS